MKDGSLHKVLCAYRLLCGLSGYHVHRDQLIGAKEEILMVKEKERVTVEEVVQRERRLLQTLVKQLHHTQQEKGSFDHYSHEVNREK